MYPQRNYTCLIQTFCFYRMWNWFDSNIQVIKLELFLYLIMHTRPFLIFSPILLLREKLPTRKVSLCLLFFLIFLWRTFCSLVDKSEKPHDQVIGPLLKLNFHSSFSLIILSKRKANVVATWGFSFIPCVHQ